MRTPRSVPTENVSSSFIDKQTNVLGHEYGRRLTQYGVDKLEKRIMADGGFTLKTSGGGGGLDSKHKFMLRAMEVSENTEDGPDQQYQYIDGHHRDPLYRK